MQTVEAKREKLASSDGLDDELIKIASHAFDVKAESTKEMRELWRQTGVGSVIFAIKPGDGSAREQAASCQKVLGGQANIAIEYATKRYTSNLINGGMLPFTIESEAQGILEVDDYIYF